MVFYFPKPLPDELFYSILSRYHSHTLSPVIQVGYSLFGTSSFSSNFHIPNKIKTVVSRIATVNFMDVDTFIKDHTLYPFLASFGDKKRSERMYNFMAVGGERFVLNRISGLELGIYKYCPLCAIEDRSNYGEAYWHRVHNLPSVISCTKHKCHLKSYIAKQNETISYSLVTAESVVDTSGEIEAASDLEVSEDLVLEEILFGKTRLDFQEVHLIAKNKNLIRIAGGKVFPLINKKLRSYVEEWHPRFLNLVASENLDYRLPAILSGNSDGTQPRLCLLIKEFVEWEKDPFSLISLCCINKSCTHYSLTLNRDCWEIIKKGRRKGFIYTVRCPYCGLVFNRNTLSRTFRCIEASQQLIDEIKALYNSRNSIRYIQRQYGLPRKFLKKIILGISVVPSDNHSPRPINKSLQKKYRELWLSALKSGKYKTLNDLIAVMSAAQNWLYRHNREWVTLVNNKYLKKTKRQLKPKNYGDIDEELFKRLKDFVSGLDLKTFPKRLTKSLFNSNIRGLKNVDLKKLPKSSRYLSSNLENHSKYRRRCINYNLNK